MSVRTKEQLKQDFSDNLTATGAKFADLIDSLKAVQSAVSDPAASGTSITFIATISQDTNGEIVVTKKTVNFNGYQTTAGMSEYQTVAGMSDYQTVADMNKYQSGDVQETGLVNISGTGSDVSTDVTHNKGHYPTVRLMDDSGYEIRPKTGLESPYSVQHIDEDKLKIILDGSLNVPGAKYTYILD